uniref:Uncharacterized protein n=1 Tax=Arundo donax TaxID=35708 RepID=A0A0A9F338_ARUDO
MALSSLCIENTFFNCTNGDFQNTCYLHKWTYIESLILLDILLLNLV